MNRDDAVAIMRNLPIIKAIAEGRDVYFASFNCDGEFMGWRATQKILLSNLGSGLYSVKPRYQYIGPKDRVAIPYPQQAAYINGGRS